MFHGSTIASRIPRVAFGALAVGALGGCNTMRGTPTRYEQPDAVVAAINLTAQDMADLALTQDAVDRNLLQNKAIAVIDQRYADFVRALAADRADAATAVEGTTLGAATAGAVVTSVAAKTNYATLGATVIGAFGIFDRNYYYEKTAPVLIAGMDAARTQVLLRIKTEQQRLIHQYDGASAARDVEAYYTAGTLIGAINDITARAQAATQDGQSRILALKPLSDAEIGRNDALVRAIHALTTPEHVERGNRVLKALDLTEQSDARGTRRALLNELRSSDGGAKTDALEAALKKEGLLK